MPSLVVAGAWGVAEADREAPPPLQEVITSINLPAVAESQTSGSYIHEERIRAGDSIASLLSRLQVDDDEASRFLRTSAEARPFVQLKPGRIYRAETDKDGELLRLSTVQPEGVEWMLSRNDDQFKVESRPVSWQPRPVMKSGTIVSSFFGATDKADLPDSVAMQMVELFSTDIDFHRDLQKGDRFTVVYEMLEHQGQTMKPGRLLAAEFINAGKRYQAVYFERSPGQGDYYAPDGKSLRKAFLRSPLEFTRISSGFSAARLHPIFKTWKAHKGIDFAASTGTKVKSTADGTVLFAGTKAGYGNVVEVKHFGDYSTVYAHLSAISKGVKTGAKIQQGDIVGLVGSTGYATGPHLHYEFKIAGEQKDPLALKLPTPNPLSRTDMPRFAASSAALMHQLDQLSGTNLARFE
ncbi:M23 family metallopeptidase [Parachitinimonas caeni]|uniref:Peptidoglycan DD-metalloendopeptidase family protein n=1 Tax=Parachitinimonas caeni TaxID=3031301 RepID=A0ABT7DTG9_9NEIS|nr:peptidoglycan DD-metalloendopeptidase family protein [Parachitinimonas caeni]MDK2123381.1 peptidoglycan DD-metalloendopeptidase family protein [Parachitinimonas caeni]